MRRLRLTGYAGSLLAGLLLASGAEAQQGSAPSTNAPGKSNINTINATAPLTANGGASGTGPTVTLALTTPLSKSQVSATTAYTDQANTFSGDQTFAGNLSTGGFLALKPRRPALWS